jgi:preprotein translocase subunit SecG
MSTVLLVIHIMVAASMIVIILLQRSEGGALGMGGGGGGFVTGRGAVNLLTRMTAILAAIFFTTSIALGIFSHRSQPTSAVGVSAPAAPGAPASGPVERAPGPLPSLKMPKSPAETPATQAPAPAPAAPAQPQLPQSQ